MDFKLSKTHAVHNTHHLKINKTEEKLNNLHRNFDFEMRKLYQELDDIKIAIEKIQIKTKNSEDKIEDLSDVLKKKEVKEDIKIVGNEIKKVHSELHFDVSVMKNEVKEAFDIVQQKSLSVIGELSEDVHNMKQEIKEAFDIIREEVRNEMRGEIKKEMLEMLKEIKGDAFSKELISVNQIGKKNKNKKILVY